MHLFKKSKKLLVIIGLIPQLLLAQNESSTEDLFALSLEELMNVPINSASKRDETLFDAPLSSYTITKADIVNSGATSIMEALRLAPGVIVREQTNGVYDIHIRGFDNALRTTEVPYPKSNLSTLVMIDNRPVFNNNLGGTFWESLPIDLNDVERIEIVRGPSAPLFGPNAVSGVINIITNRLKKDQETIVNATAQYGSHNTTIANATIGKNFGKLGVILSGNFQDRERFDDKYYNTSSGEFVDASELTGNPNRYPDVDRAIEKYGANLFLTYKATENVSFDLSGGMQNAQLQKIFVGGPNTYFNSNETNTEYVNLAVQAGGISFRSSYVNGFDDINLGVNPGRYDYNTFESNLEYAWKLSEKNVITPGISYQSTTYSDEEYAEGGNGFLNSEKNISTVAGFVRADIHPTESWRVIAAIRGDKFSTPDKTRVSYELASTYKLSSSNLIRAAFTQSNSGSFIGNNFLDVTDVRTFPAPINTIPIYQRGNEDLDLFTIRMFELGYRSKISRSFQLDVDVFHQTASNYSTLIVTEFYPAPINMIPYQLTFQNLPTELVQIGTTISINYVPNEKLQLKPFVTIQNTETKDLPSLFVDPDLGIPVEYQDDDHKNTPSWYGGFYLNYSPLAKLNINLSNYTYAAHNQYDPTDPEGTGLGKTDAKFIVNAKVSYEVIENLYIFFNGRNCLNQDQREFFGADRIGSVYLGGLSFEIK